MNSHLSELGFSVETVEREPRPSRIITRIIVDAPLGFLAAMHAKGARFSMIAFDRFEKDLKSGPDSAVVGYWSEALHDFQAEWHPFIGKEQIESKTDSWEIDAIEEAAELFELPPAVVWAGVVSVHFTLDRRLFFPRPARPDRRRAVPDNAVLFPGVEPWGPTRRRSLQNA